MRYKTLTFWVVLVWLVAIAITVASETRTASSRWVCSEAETASADEQCTRVG